jgi:lysophospholipase L1-like esterase
MTRITSAVVAVSVCLSLSTAQGQTTSWKFDFGSGKVADGYTQVLPTTTYAPDLGYGFEPGATVQAIDRGGADARTSDFCTSDRPFLFSIRAPEGNYKVTMTLGDSSAESTTTVKAELRRLMLEKVQTAAGQFETRTIIVNVRTPAIAGDGEVSLKPREKGSEWPAWDDKLTLEFNNTRPCLCAMEVEKIGNIPTVYILGDSTVCDQPAEPWNSWGQMLPRFFKPDIAVSNQAESGESIRSSLGARRFSKVWSTIRQGDYLFVQFGHNDMKSKAPNALETYKSDLQEIVAEARKRGATPVLVTSMERKAGIENDTLAGYPDAVRQVAGEDSAALIDLHAVSKVFYKALGANLDKAFQDGTHHNNYGSYELAKCIAQEIRDSKLDLAQHIADDFQGYDPARPDPPEGFAMPASPQSSAAKPLGN